MAKKIGKPLASFGRDRLRLLLHGEPGSGKTTKASSIAEVCKTLYLYVPGEPGKTSIPQEYSDNMSFEKIDSYDTLADIFWSLQVDDHNFEAVVFEGVSPLQSLFLRESKKYVSEKGIKGMARERSKASPSTDARRLYGDVVPLLTDTMIFWYSLADGDRENPINVVFTSQTRYRRKDEEDEGEDPKWRPDVSPGSWNAVEANPDFIGYCAIEPDLEDMDADAVVYTVRFQGTDQILAKMHAPIERARAIKQKFPGAVFGRSGSEVTVPALAKAWGVPLK